MSVKNKRNNPLSKNQGRMYLNPRSLGARSVTINWFIYMITASQESKLKETNGGLPRGLYRFRITRAHTGERLCFYVLQISLSILYSSARKVKDYLYIYV